MARTERIQNLEAMLQDADRRLAIQNQKFEEQLSAVKDRLEQARSMLPLLLSPIVRSLIPVSQLRKQRQVFRTSAGLQSHCVAEAGPPNPPAPLHQLRSLRAPAPAHWDGFRPRMEGKPSARTVSLSLIAAMILSTLQSVVPTVS